jgi:trans-aconitate methyltransferase
MKTTPRKKPQPVPFVGNSLTPDQYFEHWKAREIWTHLEQPKHRKRLYWCADQCVGETFADIGCMLGHSTAIMARRHPGAWTGFDFSAKAIEGASGLFPELRFMYAERPELLTGWSKFDSVVCSEVIEHIEDDAAFLSLLMGIAAKRLILTTPCINAQDPGHVRIYTRETLDALFEGYGAVVDKDDSFFYVTIEAKE